MKSDSMSVRSVLQAFGIAPLATAMVACSARETRSSCTVCGSSVRTIALWVTQAFWLGISSAISLYAAGAILPDICRRQRHGITSCRQPAGFKTHLAPGRLCRKTT